MPTLVKVRKWGNSLGLRLPKSFASKRAIVNGATVDIDKLVVIGAPRRARSRYRLKNVLNGYARPGRLADFPPAGKELA